MAVTDSKPVACKFCGATDLYWSRVMGGNYILVDANEVKHNCPNDPKNVQVQKSEVTTQQTKQGEKHGS